MKSFQAVFRSLLTLISFAAAGVSGADIVWTNVAGGNWTMAANWSPNQTPGLEDHAIITNAGNYTVVANATTLPRSFVLGGSAGTQTLELSSSATFLLAAASVVESNGVLALNGGNLGGDGELTIRGRLN